MGMVASLVTPLATDGLDWEWEVATHSRPGHGARSSSSPIPGDLGIHWRTLWVASFMPFDIPAAASVKETVAALARQRFMMMELTVSAIEPVARINSQTTMVTAPPINRT